ncbi:MAG: energy transducer TonB, partial [Bosea sp.]|nr:energy transducer TonB [Bosea sp. (in: a-proteobacteria)]
MIDLETEPRPSKRLWVSAAIGALALHLAGVALAVAHLRTDGDDGTLGATAFEVGVFSSPHVEQNDLPPGPDSDASTASPQLNEQKAEVKQTDLPKDMPHEADDPDRIVTQNESNKPKEDEPKVA